MKGKGVKKSILWAVMMMVGISFSAYGSYFDWQKGLASALVQGIAGTLYTYQNGQMIGIYDIPGGVVQHMANGNIAFMERYVPNYNQEQVIGWLEQLEEEGILDEEEVALLLQAINSKSVNDIFNYLSQQLTIEEMKNVILAFACSLYDGSVTGGGDDYKSFVKKLTGEEKTLSEFKTWLDELDDDRTETAWGNTESWLGENTDFYGELLGVVTSMVGKDLTLNKGGINVTVTISSISLDDWKQMGSGYLTSFSDILDTDIATNEIWGALGELIKKGEIDISYDFDNDGNEEDSQTVLEMAMKKFSYVAKTATYYTYSSEGYLETTWSYVTDKNGNIVKRAGFWVDHEKEIRDWLEDEDAGKDLPTIDTWLADVEHNIEDILDAIGGVIESDIKERIISDFHEMPIEGIDNIDTWEELVYFLTGKNKPQGYNGPEWEDSNYKYFENWISGGYWAETNDYLANTTYYINGKLDHIEGWYQSYNLNAGENKYYLTAADIEKLGVDDYFSYLEKNLSEEEKDQVVEKAQEVFNATDQDFSTLAELKGYIGTDETKLATLKNDVIEALIQTKEISDPIYDVLQAAGTVSDTVWTKGELFFVYQTNQSMDNYGKLQYAIGNLGVYGGEIGDIGDVGYTGMGVIVADSLGRAVQVWEINPTINEETGSQHVVDINRDNANSLLGENRNKTNSLLPYIASLTLRGKIEYDAIDRVMWVGIYNGQTNVATSSTQDLNDILNNEYLGVADAYQGLVRQVSYTYKGTRRDSRTEIYLDTTKVVNKWNLTGMVEKLEEIFNGKEAEVTEIIKALQQNALEEVVDILDKKLNKDDKEEVAEELGYDKSLEGWNKFVEDAKAGKVALSEVVSALDTLEDAGTISLPSEVNLTHLDNIAKMDSLDDITSQTN
ncbi:MAG TPA: hypothetical protein ENG47_04700 [Candidatus Aerophobetes bacterium]|uniref:Uncharacterized protein n=1 Tax=Aerophobetes bacterium TaxID=2030807 RepID=A0A7V0QQR5_UNCAE|nr:hypothetical protein [Candidatus Aerophobetes bacterium]